MNKKFKPTFKLILIGLLILSACSAGAVVIAGNFNKNDDMKFTAQIVDDSQNVLDTIPFGIGLRGDSNGDGKVSISDASLIAKYMAKAHFDKNLVNEYKKTLGGAMADANNDGTLSIKDALTIAKYISRRHFKPDLNWDDIK